MGKPHVLVIPYPAQGHVIPILELARCLVTQGIKVTFINTEVNHQLVMNNCCLDKDDFGDLMQMVSIPDGLEPWEDRSDLCKLTSSILQTMPNKLEELIETINQEDDQCKVSCVIADACVGWALKVANKFGIKTAGFWSSSVATLALFLAIPKLIDDGIIDKNGIPQSSEIILLSETMPPIKPRTLTWMCFEDSAMVECIFQVALRVVESSNLTEWFICNSNIVLEAAALSLYPQVSPIGPLLASNRLADQTGHFWQEDPTCLTWLDQQQPCSVIYIAFGSFTIFNQTQFEELALGLDLCNRPFLWVVRPGMTKETTTNFPHGFKDRVGSRGTIVSWAPQQKVLAHPSIACFVSHCGWNSTLEGVASGVPFLCWPYFGDQFYNETYICEIWKTGLALEKDEAGIITRGEIISKVERLLRDKMYKDKALDIKEKLASSTREGGCSHGDLNNFIEWIQKNDSYVKDDQVDSL